jgi:hypothetical protein
MKICPVGAVLFHADGHTDRQTDRRTDVAKLTVAFRNSDNAANNKLLITDVPNLCVIYNSDEEDYLTFFNG